VRPTPFVLLTKSRSGSKWLVELLDSHSQLAVYGELFGGAQVRSDYGAQDMPRFEDYVRNGSAIGRALPLELLRVRYLRHLYASRNDVRAIGVKLVFAHATRAVHAYLSARRVRVVHLVRANMLDAVISSEVASARRFAGARVGETAPAVSIRLDAETLYRRLTEHEHSISAARSRLLLYRLPTLEVFYEELVARHDGTIAPVLDFLGADPTTVLWSTFAPIDDVPREDVLENLDEVRAALAGTRFEWMLAPGVRARATA
jgi:LPS sulfotransferase NodH